MKLLNHLQKTNAPAALLLIRLLVGAVFLSEGIQKFLYPDDRGRGAARFRAIGFEAPEFTAAFVASFEVACGILILLGLLTRLAVVPTITIMIVAIVTTKVPILMNRGFWDMAHDARTDWSMFLGSLFLLIVGAGPVSLDARISRRRAGAG